jgi:signal transduction histidine kinase
VGALLAWTRASSSRDDADFATNVETFGRAVVEKFPSLLTPEFLDRSEALTRKRGLSSDAIGKWRELWQQDEAVRRGAHEENSRDGNEAARWIVTDRGTLWIEPDGGDLRSVPIEAFRLAAERLKATTPSLPVYSALAVAWDDTELLTTAPFAEVLAAKVSGRLSIRALLEDPARLYRQQRWQTFWLAALLGVALVTVLLAFFAMQRALLSERQLSHQKSDFVASVSHELRAPVASMRLMLENLQTGAVRTDSERENYLHLLESECRRLSALIENVLDFARIEHRRKIYHFSETDVPALIRDAIDLLQPRAAQRRQEIHSDVQPLPSAPCIDAVAVQQALINLIDNAIKFSPLDTTIEVTVAQHDEANWELSVVDQGPGIPADEHARIFERFYRIGDELRRETQGSGIGLSIVKHTVAAHRGRIVVASQPGSGATFRLIIPYACEAIATPVSPEAIAP